MIRTAVFAALALGALAAPAFAFETQSVPVPKMGGAFSDRGIFRGMMPGTTGKAFHFGPAEPQPLVPQLQASKKPTVIYEIKDGRTADRVDVTDPRQNPFMPQPERSAEAVH